MSSGPSSPVTIDELEREQVGVDEDDDVAGGGGQRPPQRLALARHRRQARQHVVAVHDVGAGRAATSCRGVGRPGVDDDELVDERLGDVHQVASDRSRRCRRPWPPRSSAGSTTLTVVLPLAASSRSSGQSAARRRSAARTSARRPARIALLSSLRRLSRSWTGFPGSIAGPLRWPFSLEPRLMHGTRIDNFTSLIQRGRGNGPMKPRQPPVRTANRSSEVDGQVPTPARTNRWGQMRKGLRMTASLDAPGASCRRLSPTSARPRRWSVASAAPTFPLGASYACKECFGPLEVGYDFGTVTHADIEAGPQSMWRYAPLLPVPADVASRRNLAPGMTQLVRADNLARELGMKTLWVKDDSGNPTHSFKDRVVASRSRPRKQLGFTTVACASTGNLANAVAAAAARAGLRSCVFVPSDLEAGKIVTTAVYGGTLVAVEGNYDDVNRLCSEVAGDLGWGFVNVNLRPYYAEGSKTRRLRGRRAARLAPAAAGRLADRVRLAADQGRQGVPRAGDARAGRGSPVAIFGAQATGCSPVGQAFNAGHDVVQPVRPDTIAKSLAIGNPADGPYALDVARRTGGAIADVSDDEVVEGIRLLAATEGIFAETAGGVTVATLRKLLADGRLDPDAETVLLNTGDGLKTLDAVVPVAAPIGHHRHPSTARSVPSLSRRASRERVRPGPDHPAHLHRRASRGDRRGRRRSPRSSTPSRSPTPASGPGARRRGAAAPLRQRVRQRRRRAVRRGAGHRHPGRHLDLDHPRRRRRLSPPPSGLGARQDGRYAPAQRDVRTAEGVARPVKSDAEARGA